MSTLLSNVNWLAVIVGTVLSFGLGMVWFGQIFGKVWAAGSHNLSRPESLPLAAMLAQLTGTFLLALVIGATETIQDLPTAIVAILAQRDAKGRASYTQSQVESCRIGLASFAGKPGADVMLARLVDAKKSALDWRTLARRMSEG